MENKEFTGTLEDMAAWMQENGCTEEQISKFSASFDSQAEGLAPNCRRYVSGYCGNNDMCLEYTIECCTIDEHGQKICGETTVCSCKG